MKINKRELGILKKAKEANAWWFEAMIQSSAVMIERRAKYAGDNHPYFNFAVQAQDMNMPLYEVIKFYLMLKVNRLRASTKDFEDESHADTYLDLANYALIMLGSLLRPEEVNVPAILENVERTGAKYLDPTHFWENAQDYWPAVVVDFNGVFDQYEGWNGEVREFPPADGIDVFLKELRTEFKCIIVVSATMPIEKVMSWLEKYKLNHLVDYVSNHKPPARVYIDDKAVRHEGDFEETFVNVMNNQWAHWQKNENSLP